MKNDRAVFAVDADMKNILEFMHRNIPTGKLVGLADNMPALARLLWGNVPQEPCVAVSLELLKMVPENPLPRASTESSPVRLVSMVILRRQRFVVSVDSFVAAGDTSIYPRPAAAGTRFIQLVEFRRAS